MDNRLLYLKREVRAYELDPNHTITQAHVKLRQECVVAFGGETVREVIKQVYQELLDGRIEKHHVVSAVPEPTVPVPRRATARQTRKEIRRTARRQERSEMRRMCLNHRR